MTGAEINQRLERSWWFGCYYDIRELKANPGFATLQVPSDLTFAQGVVDSVSEQAHRIDADWDDVNKRLTLSLNAGGEGYWIPYLGNGPSNLVGMAQTANHGLGTYTPVIAPGSPISWVVTGAFSGCSSASFKTPAGMHFAHLITPPETGVTCDTIANQRANVAAQLNIPATAPDVQVQQVLSGTGEGYVFWTFFDATWHRRVVWAFGGKVKAVDRRTKV